MMISILITLNQPVTIAFVKEDNVGRLLICSGRSFHRLMVDGKKLLRYDSVLACGMTKQSPFKHMLLDCKNQDN